MNHSRKKWLIFLFMSVFLSLGAVHAFDTDSFIRNSSIQYEKRFSLDTSLVRWHLILDHPVLMAHLWELYECKPSYRINLNDGRYTIVDPTGIQGSLSLLSVSPVERMYFGKGKMKNWFLPLSLKGSALFFVESAERDNKTDVRFRVYGEGGDDLVTRILLKAVSPVLYGYIDRRVSRNIGDLGRIIADIENNPDAVRQKLSGQKLDEFNHSIGKGTL